MAEVGRVSSTTRALAWLTTVTIGRPKIAAARVQKALAQVLGQQSCPRHVACAAIEGTPGRVLLNDAGESGLLVLDATGVSTPQEPGPVARYCLQLGRSPLAFVPASRLPDVTADVAGVPAAMKARPA